MGHENKFGNNQEVKDHYHKWVFFKTRKEGWSVSSVSHGLMVDVCTSVGMTKTTQWIYVLYLNRKYLDLNRVGPIHKNRPKNSFELDFDERWKIAWFMVRGWWPSQFWFLEWNIFIFRCSSLLFIFHTPLPSQQHNAPRDYSYCEWQHRLTFRVSGLFPLAVICQ